jgi:competence protein ComEC
MRLVALAVAWAAGIVIAAALPEKPLTPWLGALAVGALLCLPRFRRMAGMAGVLLVLLGLGGLRLSLAPETSDISRLNGQGGMTIHGIVSGSPIQRDIALSIPVAVERVERGGTTTPSSGQVLVEAPPQTVALPGSRISATGLLVQPSGGDRFSYADYLARRGIYSQMTQAFVQVFPPDNTFSPDRFLYQLRADAQTRISTALPDPYAALLSGIVLGDDSGLAPEIEAAFAATGTAHIVAISGFNMIVISQVVSTMLASLGLSARKTALLSLLFIGLYTAFVGGSAPILRAALMSGLLVVAPLVRRRAYVPASVALVVLLLSVFDPWVLWDLGFQFSVAATLGLAVFAAPLTKRIDGFLARFLSGRLLGLASAFVTAPLAATLAAQITTLPTTILSFGSLSLVLIPVNLLVLPVQPAILLLGGLGVIASALFAPLGQLLFWAALLPLAWTTSIIRAFAALPFAQVDASLNPTLATVYLLALGVFAVLEAVEPGWRAHYRGRVRQRALLLAASGVSTGVIVLSAALVLARPDGQLRVTFLDVGHSNAVLIQTPGGAQILVDGGRLPSRLLTALGDRMPFSDQTIETLILTQPDPNEYEALAAVAARYSMPLLVTNGQPNAAESWTALVNQLALAQHQTVTADMALDLSDGTRIEFLNPTTTPMLTDSLNDSALVLRVVYGDVDFLLTGDLGRSAQARLATQPLARTTVLQLPQHGTARSLDSDFLAAVNPQVIVVQAAADNRRGDPDGDVLNLLGSAQLIRTDEAGTIQFSTDGVRLWMQADAPVRSPHLR